jgi:hypothetical protein
MDRIQNGSPFSQPTPPVRRDNHRPFQELRMGVRQVQSPKFSKWRRMTHFFHHDTRSKRQEPRLGKRAIGISTADISRRSFNDGGNPGQADQLVSPPLLGVPGYPIDATDPQDAAARGQIAPKFCGEHNRTTQFFGLMASIG